MGKVRQAQGADAEKASLRAEFPSWSIIMTDTNRWWATRPVERARTDALPRRGQVVTELDADSAEELRGKLRRVADEETTGGKHPTGDYMALPRDLWQATLTALASDDVQQRRDISLRLTAGAPYAWETGARLP